MRPYCSVASCSWWCCVYGWERRGHWAMDMGMDNNIYVWLYPRNTDPLANVTNKWTLIRILSMGGREKVDRERETGLPVPSQQMISKRSESSCSDWKGWWWEYWWGGRLVAEEKKGERREEDAEQLNRYIFIWARPEDQCYRVAVMTFLRSPVSIWMWKVSSWFDDGGLAMLLEPVIWD